MIAGGPPRLLNQVLDNLLRNACKLSAGQLMTDITFGCTAAEGITMAYFVRDKGAGFGMEHFQKLFVRSRGYIRLQNWLEPGICLTVTQRFIQRHGGRVRLEAAPGQDATPRFTLIAARL